MGKTKRFKNVKRVDTNKGTSGDTSGAVAVLFQLNAENNTVTFSQNIFSRNNASTVAGNCFGGGLSVYFLRISMNNSVASSFDVFDANGCSAQQQVCYRALFFSSFHVGLFFFREMQWEEECRYISTETLLDRMCLCRWDFV